MPEILPRYRLMAPFYAPNDVLYPEEAILEFDGVPNEYMEPLNRAAEEKLDAYLATLGGYSRDLADITEEAVRNRPRESAVTVPAPATNVPIMGNELRALEGRARRGRPPKVEQVEQAPEQRYRKMPPVMGTVTQHDRVDSAVTPLSVQRVPTIAD